MGKINVRYAHPGDHLHKQDSSLEKLEDLFNNQGYDKAMLIIDGEENPYRQKPYERGSQPKMEEWENREVELDWLINEARMNHDAPLFAVLGHNGTYSIIKVWSSTDVEKPIVYVGSGDRMAALNARTVFAKRLEQFTLQEMPDLKQHIGNYIATLKEFTKKFKEDEGNKGRLPKVEDLDQIEEYGIQNSLGFNGAQLRDKVSELTGIGKEKNVGDALYKFERILSKVKEYEQELLDQQARKEKGVGEDKIKKDERFTQTLKEDIVALKKRKAYLEYLIGSLKKINEAGISQKYINSLAKSLTAQYNLKVNDVKKTDNAVVIEVESPAKFTRWTFDALQKALADKGMEAKEWGENEEKISSKFTIEIPTTLTYKNLNAQFKNAVKVFIDPNKDMPLERIISTLDTDFLKEYTKVINEILAEDIENIKSDKKKGLIDSIKSLFTKTDVQKYMQTETGDQELKTEEQFYGEKKK